MHFIRNHHRFIFYSSWLLLSIFQSSFTELQDDEAYYWVYSNFLSWGYFDHPPMIALMIKAGYVLFKNELGVRLMAVLMNLFSLMIIEHLIPHKNPFLFYAIALSMAVLQVSGFIAAPDIPLIFFTAAFFWCYKKFIEDASLINILLTGIAASLLLYSKYHGVLIIFFVLLSNLKLLKTYQLYAAGLVAFIFFLPHIWWQWQHSWVSFRYHLLESNVNPYKFSYTLAYVAGQFLLAGPLAGFLLLPAAFMYRSKNTLEKSLRFTLTGIYVFFFLSTFKGKVEANWTSPVLVPLMILSHQFLNNNEKWKRLLYKTLPFTIAIVLFFRIIMVADIVPLKFVKQHYHAWKNWPQQMKEKTKGLPVVFNNSYQRASKYWFYTGQVTYSQNEYRERRNNYNFWPVEDSLLGKPVYILDIYQLSRFPDSLKTAIGRIGYKYDSAFCSFARLLIVPDKKNISIKEKNSFTMSFTATMPQHYYEFLIEHPGLKNSVVLGIFRQQKWIKDISVPYTLLQILGRRLEVKINPQLPKGKYYMRFAVKAGETLATHNSDKIKLIIE